jgi:hypothetical protein
MFIFNFVVQFLNKRHFRSKIGDIAPLKLSKTRRNSMVAISAIGIGPMLAMTRL